MKKILFLAIIAMIGLQTQAQIVSSRSSMITREVIDRGGWSTIGVEYLPSTFKLDGSSSSKSFTGLAINYTNAISLSQKIPFFLEWGIGGQYSFCNYDEKSHEYSIKVVSVKAPVNFIYDIALPNTNIHLDPFVGVKFRVNVWGEIKEEYRGKSETYNIFGDKGTGKRFQAGLQLGLKARFNNKFFIGAGYGFDFNEVWEKCKIQEVKLMAGFVF